MLLFSHTLVTIATPSPSISTVLLPAVMKKLSIALLFLILSSPLPVPFTSVKISERKNAISTLIYQFVLSHPLQQHNHRSHRWRCHLIIFPRLRKRNSFTSFLSFRICFFCPDGSNCISTLSMSSNSLLIASATAWYNLSVVRNAILELAKGLMYGPGSYTSRVFRPSSTRNPLPDLSSANPNKSHLNMLTLPDCRIFSNHQYVQFCYYILMHQHEP